MAFTRELHNLKRHHLLHNPTQRSVTPPSFTHPLSLEECCLIFRTRCWWQTGGGCGVCRKLGLGKVGQRQPPDRRLSQFCSRPAGLKLGHLQTSIPSGGECTCSAEEANWTPGSLVSATSPAIFGQIRSASLLTTSAISAGPCICSTYLIRYFQALTGTAFSTSLEAPHFTLVHLSRKFFSFHSVSRCKKCKACIFQHIPPLSSVTF